MMFHRSVFILSLTMLMTVVLPAPAAAAEIHVTNCNTVGVPRSTSAVSKTAVTTQAAAALSYCQANNGAPPGFCRHCQVDNGAPTLDLGAGTSGDQ